MALTIEISPELESRLREEAARRGVDPREYIVNALRERLQGERRSVPCLPADESELLDEINKGFSEADWKRYYELVEKRRAEQISPEENGELVAASDRLEQLNVRRMDCLVRLARLRKTTLPQLMDQLGIEPPSVI